VSPDPADETPVEQTMSIPVTAPVAPAGGVAEVMAQLGIGPLRPGTGMVVVRRGPNPGARFLLDTDVVAVGRHPDSAVLLDDVTVSRRHAEFRRRPGGWLVRDVGSLNGTYVQHDRVDEVGLRHGDDVQIGKYRLLFLSADEAADRDPAGDAAAEGGPAEGGRDRSEESSGGTTG